jgi:hypothetical protein
MLTSLLSSPPFTKQFIISCLMSARVDARRANCRPPDWPTSAPNRQIEWPMSAALCCQFAVTSRNEQHVVHPSPLIFFEHPVASKGQSLGSFPRAAYYTEIVAQMPNINLTKIYKHHPTFYLFPRVKPNNIVKIGTSQ